MDVFDLYAKISLDTSEYEGGLGRAKKSSSGFAKAAKVSLAAIATTTAAVTKMSLDTYSSFEQLSGGAKKIFDEMDISKIALDTREAYKTMGMSADGYLSVINDVGASFTATMGDERGYETAKTGLQAISDYASGTSKSVDQLSQKYAMITRSTASYQSIADQFSGILPATTEAFLEQAQAAGFLEGSYKTLTDVPIAEYQAAVTQMLQKGTADLGLAGNTAMEAATTISGAGQMAKAAWENFLVAVADPTQDLDAATKALTDSIGAVADNAIPRVLTIVPRLASAFTESSDAVRLLVDGMEIAGVVMAGQFAGRTVAKVVTGYQNARVQVALFTAANGKAAAASAALNGTLSVGETVVGALTGKINLLTVAQEGWNTAVAANPIGIFVAALGSAVVMANKARGSIKDYGAELAGTASTSDEAARHLEVLKVRLAEIGETNPNKMTREQRKEFSALNNAIQIVEGQYESLIATEEAFGATAQNTTEILSEEDQKFLAETENFSKNVEELLKTYEATYSGILSNVQGWFGPFETAKVTVKTSVEEMMAAMASQEEFNNTYSSNLQTLAEVGLGGLASAFQEAGPQGAAYAQTIVDAITEAGGATSEGGQAIIDNFKQMSADLSDSEAELSNTMTTMSGEFDSAMQAIAESLASGVEGMDKAGEARLAAENTLAGYAAGLDSSKGPIFKILDEIAAKVASTLGAVPGLGGGKGSSGGVAFGPGFATGLNYVPYDDFPAYLHRGEAVLTAPEARAWRNGEGRPNPGRPTVVVNQYIQTVPQTPAEFGAATEAYIEQARWTL